MRLPSVLTLSEVSYVWGKARNTIIMACLRDKLVYRKADAYRTDRGVYLIETASVIKLWGNPVNEL